MHKTIEEFYKSILRYAGLDYDPDKNIIVNIDSHLGEFKVNDKYVTLPYENNLKYPNGKMIMHPLNENYVKPESSFFLAYKKRLTVEINIKICELIDKIMGVATDPKKVALIKDKNLIELFSSINEVDMKSIEDFTRIISKAMKEHEDGFVVEFILSKNANNKFKYASAVGFVKFNLYNDIVQALENKEYKLYKQPIRKRDLENLKAIHEHIFKGNLSEDYQDETENKRFRYLTILLKTSYLIASIVNEYINLINTDLKLEGEEKIKPLDTEWVDIIQKVYELDTEIRLIPNQDEYTDSSVEAIKPSKLKLNEESLKNVQINSPQTQNTFNQQPQQPIYTPPMQQVTQPQQPNTQQTLDPLQVLKQASQQQMYQQSIPMTQYMPMTTYQPQAPMPLWMQRELMSSMPQMPQPNIVNHIPIQYDQSQVSQIPVQYQHPQQNIIRDPQTGMLYLQTPNGLVPYNNAPMYPYMQQPRYTAG